MPDDTDPDPSGQLTFPWFGCEQSVHDDSIMRAPVIRPEPTAPAPTPRDDRGQELLQYLRARIKHPIDLTITNNAISLMSLRPATAGKGVRVRVHHMFLTAPEPVREALAHWITHPRSRKHLDLIRGFFRENLDKVRRRTRKTALRTAGSTYDLGAFFHRLNHKYFGGGINAQITWGRLSRQGGRSIRLGSYNHDANLISIHPCLDHPEVPPCVVRQIVHHEMIHAHLRNRDVGRARRLLHDRVFQALEQAGEDYQEAEKWLTDEENIGRMIRHRTQQKS